MWCCERARSAKCLVVRRVNEPNHILFHHSIYDKPEVVVYSELLLLSIVVNYTGARWQYARVWSSHRVIVFHFSPGQICTQQS